MPPRATRLSPVISIVENAWFGWFRLKWADLTNRSVMVRTARFQTASGPSVNSGQLKQVLFLEYVRIIISGVILLL